MKGKHLDACIEIQPCCLCNTCKHDSERIYELCCDRTFLCPVENCPDYEPDDEEDDHA